MLSFAIIEAEYQRLGSNLGWRFLTCPERNIKDADMALVTINPGGRVFEPARWSVERGSAYVVESWKGSAPGEERLQRQVRRMFELLGVNPTDVLSGYLVPFRSPDWGQLAHKGESLAFGVRLWRCVFSHSRAKTVFAFGKESAGYLAEVLTATLASRSYAGWGDQTIDEYRFGAGGRMIVLPHLSRYGLFGRAESEAAFLAALSMKGLVEKTLGQAAREPSSQRIIRLLVTENPKTGKSRARFACYRDGMTTAQYENAVRDALGPDEARNCGPDLKWDSDPKRRFIRMEQESSHDKSK